ncbi:MAG: cation:proton antiporter [Betaproteobacteria bacterium]|nr:cation:proton antiporter [Betaproteobacteria bacterium]
MPSIIADVINSEFVYLLLALGLLVAPKALQRFRIPAPITCFVFGIVVARTIDGVPDDVTLKLLSTLGISSLFLFAGLEVDITALNRDRRPLIGHLLIQAALLAGVAYAGMHLFGFGWQPATLLALALLTPSTGFILDTLSRLGLDEREQFSVKSKAISGELLALILMFLVLQSTSLEAFAITTSAFALLILVLPFVFIMLGRSVLPHAPGSEFSLLVMVGLIAAFVTKQLGVYYLVGAFTVGFVANRLHLRMPTLASDTNLHAIRLFASFFVPFYFFSRGAHVPAGALSWQPLLLGVILSAIFVPVRIAIVWLQRRILFADSHATSLRVSVTLMPTLIFTLVLATILRERYALSDLLFGALLVYAMLTTMLPSFVSVKRAIEFDPAGGLVGPPRRSSAQAPADGTGTSAGGERDQ